MNRSLVPDIPGVVVSGIEAGMALEASGARWRMELPARKSVLTK
jgi:hypothetical protein